MPPDARTYWTEQMEAAYGFMERLLAYPLAECGEPLCCLQTRAREADVEIAFTPGPKLGTLDRLFHVRRSLVAGVLGVAEALCRRGYLLRIEDAYRSPETQARGSGSEYVLQAVLEKVHWELQGLEPTAERVFRRLAVWSATTPKFANHTSGSAVDVSLLHRRDGSLAELGAPYPELSHRTPMDSPFVSAEARRNRRMLCEIFAEHGFLPYPYEFWHFSHGDADYEMIAGRNRPARFGPVHRAGEDGHVVPVDDPLRPFLTVEDVRSQLARLPRA